MTYCVVCPDIDPLTAAAADFFQQLGTGEFYKFWTGSFDLYMNVCYLIFFICACGNIVKLIV